MSTIELLFAYICSCLGVIVGFLFIKFSIQNHKAKNGRPKVTDNNTENQEIEILYEQIQEEKNSEKSTGQIKNTDDKPEKDNFFNNKLNSDLITLSEVTEAINGTSIIDNRSREDNSYNIIQRKFSEKK